LIIVEGAYSMDGDICPLADIVAIKEAVGAYLLVDEAHSFGVYGATGRGIDEHFGIPPDSVDIWMGSLSKAIPSCGGFIAGTRELIIYLQHGAAPFFFSAATCPAAVAAAHASLHVLAQERERLRTLWRNALYLHDGLVDLGYRTGGTAGPIVPVIIGSDKDAYHVARMLYDRGIVTSAVVYPAVREGSARLRLCATAAQTRPMLDEVLQRFAEIRGRGVAA
jgi:7-keto-8-aminopelargonate synthetase-like enzyme